MRNCFWLGLLTAITWGAFWGPALAQEEGAQKKSRVVRAGKTVYNFDDVDITGRLKRPEGTGIIETPEFKFRRLLDLNEKFTPNIIRSVDEF